MGLSFVETNTIQPEAGERGGKSMEAVSNLDAARREYPAVMARCWGNNPVI